MAASIVGLEAPLPAEQEQVMNILNHGFKDHVQCSDFNFYGDRLACGGVDGKIRVFNRHQDGVWKLSDSFQAYQCEVVEIKWFPPTVLPNLIGTLGIDGKFRIWAEDSGAAPGRRWIRSSSTAGGCRSVLELRNNHTATYPTPYVHFDIRHDEFQRNTWLAFLSKDGYCTVLENDTPENLEEWTDVDRFQVCARPPRGSEVAFRVSFDPNPDVCYNAARAGMPSDALSLVVAAMNTCKVYRTRDVANNTGFSMTPSSGREFYLALELPGHHGLVRDVSWAPGNCRGYDMVATACQDGYLRVFKITTPCDPDDGRTWSESDLTYHTSGTARSQLVGLSSSRNTNEALRATPHSGIGAGLARSGSAGERVAAGQPGVVHHEFKELSKIDNSRVPWWRCKFDAEGQKIGACGDDGNLYLYRQKPDESWACSAALSIDKKRV